MNPIILIEQIRNTINLHEGNLTNKEYEELEDALLQEYSPKTSFAVGDKIKFYNVYVEGDRLNLNPLPAFNGADVIQNEQIAFQMKRRVELGQGFDKKDEKEISIGYETETITEVDEDGNITNSESEEYFENVKEDDITT